MRAPLRHPTAARAPPPAPGLPQTIGGIPTGVAMAQLMKWIPVIMKAPAFIFGFMLGWGYLRFVVGGRIEIAQLCLPIAPFQFISILCGALLVKHLQQAMRDVEGERLSRERARQLSGDIKLIFRAPTLD